MTKTKPRTADDFRSVVNATLYVNDVLNQLVPQPASEAKNKALQEVDELLKTVTDRIQRENGLIGGESA
ncbi:hypothetical protein DFP93_102155 [Aneurinibacillus soli]|uniref:Uncharacterized protein n=1 Tax=Aneurinibacillus soli TaxID=1500254 RepID=A0A0U5BA52_9BACL|nr:hypothetical protein [Aneurinibacillus soli]PYE63471.1 hypothetical protein DFP93_102155 [Aneurinibacillus soli]BAU27597.1 hypothetical protein CB4_01771 [Aneurinibacillus soli]